MIGNFLYLSILFISPLTTVNDSEKSEQISFIRTKILDNSELKDMAVASEMAKSVIRNSKKYNLDASKILSQIKVESNFNQFALSRSNAKGLMQIMDGTANEIALELKTDRYDIWDIDTNISFGCHYMYKMLTAFNGDYTNALRAYNLGQNNVKNIIAGKIDFSIAKTIVNDNEVSTYLVDRFGRFIIKNNKKIKISDNIPEEYKYPLETQMYINKINLYNAQFSN